MREKRSEYLILRLSPSEKQRIRARMEEMKVHNMSAFVRKMALNGYCINLQMPELRDISTQLHRLNVNLNQYTKWANISGNVYQEDVEDLARRSQQIQEDVGALLLNISKILV